MFLQLRDPATAARRPFASLDAAHHETLAGILEPEGPEATAAVLLELDPSRAGRVLGALPEPAAASACQALAEPVRASAVDLLALERRLLDRWLQREPAPSRRGGMEALTEVLAGVPHARFERLLDALRIEAPDVALAARAHLVGFEDLARLDPRSMTRLLREVPHRDLVLALVGANEPLQTAVLTSMSSRAAATLVEDVGIAGLGARPEGDVAAARLRVTWTAKRLGESGEIDLP